MYIEMNSVNKEYGSIYALENINLKINQGEWLAIMGPSGSGKSTLLNILSCLDTPTSGEYIFDKMNVSDFSIDELSKFRKDKIGLIFQQFHLFPYLNVLENVMVSQYLHSKTDEESALEMLKTVGMDHRATHLPSELSGGEKQRTCIARALINDPQIVLADEPTGNLDKENEEKVFEILNRLHKDGKTIILVTHNPKMAEMAERKITIEYGKIRSL